MALSGSRVVATGSAVQLATIVPLNVKQIDIIADPANAANIYVGTIGVTSAGVGAFLCLAPGKSYTNRANQGESINVGSDSYIVGTASDKAYVSYTD